MDLALVGVLVVVAFVVLLVIGKGQIVKGSNKQMANGAVMVVLATILGLLAMGIVLSLDVW